MRHHSRALGAASAFTALAVLSSLGALGSALPATADDASTLTVTPSQSPTVPLRVFPGQPSGPGACEGVNCTNGSNLGAKITTTSTTALAVTVTVTSEDGLNVLPKKPQTTTVSATSASNVRWSIGAQTPGFHTFSYEVSAPGVAPVDVTLPYVWRAGGPHVVQGQKSLGNALFGYNSGSYQECGESDCEFRVSKTLSFVGGTHARFGMARGGQASCAHFKDCVAAYYDDTTGIFQVGRNDIGAVTPTGGSVDNKAWFRMAYPKAGQHLAGHWTYRIKKGYAYRGVGVQNLTLSRSGHFTLGFSASRHGRVTSHLSGTYSIGRHGALRLVDRKHHKKVTETLAIVTDGAGHPRAATMGVWLGVQVQPKKGKAYLDGNRLMPKA